MEKNKRLTLDDRKKIEELLNSGLLHKKICELVGISRTTFYRDIKKCKGAYNGEEAHKNTGKSIHLIRWDIIGKRFGLLTVESYVNIYKRRTWWKCKCDCGNYTTISRKKLMEYCSEKRPLSCGCIPKQWKNADEKLPIEELALRKYEDLLKFRKIHRGCWEWTGYKQKGKCPKTSWRNKSMSVRKCMYLLMNGITFEPNPVFSKCGNLNCFNPDHITLERPKKRQYYE